jgi:hypothetical protein
MAARRSKLTSQQRLEREVRRSEKETQERTTAAGIRFDNDFILAGMEEAAREEQAPAAQRVAIVGLTADIIRRTPRGQEPITQQLRPPLVIPDQRGLSRINPLAAMLANGQGQTVTREHLRAATRLKNDYDTGVEGARSPKPATTRVDGAARDEAEYPWLDAITRYNAALDAVGCGLRGVVHAIGVDWRRAGDIATDIGMSEKVTVGLIVAGLDRLADHYNPGATQPRLTAPPLTTAVIVDASILDIPQERLGRGRIAA